MLCPQCHNEEAIYDNEYGVLPGENCQNENAQIPKPTQAATFDFASPLTKLHRQEYASEMFQPWVNGVLSKEFIETNGTSKLMGVTEKDVKNAKYVYGNMTRHHKMVENRNAKKLDVSKKLLSHK